MPPQTLQLVNTVLAALLIAAILGIARWVQGKSDKAEVAKLEVKLDAALLIVGAAITRPELAEKILAMTGRSDDRMARVMADIVQLFAKAEANAKAGAETDKRLDDLPGRVRTLEEKRSRTEE
jgi:hypothetical protein